MARYSLATKERIMSRLMPPESAALEQLSHEVGISVATLERWRSEGLTTPARGREWSAAARLEGVIATAALDAEERSAWCREHGLYPAELERWRQGATQALAEPEDARATPQATRADKRRIRELERDLQRKDRALAETTALLVLAKKLSAILPVGADA
jgi:transposase